MGYLQMKGWTKESITLLLRQSFTAAAVHSAQNSTWDKKTGIVKSDRMDETERELQAVANSWVDMSLLHKTNNTVSDSEVKEGDMVAFDWIEGGSVKTMTSQKSEEVSDAEAIDSDSSEDGSYDDREHNSDEEGYEEYSDEGGEYSEEASEEEDNKEVDPRDLNEEEMWNDMAALEDPVAELFDDEAERSAIWEAIIGGELPHKLVQLAEGLTNRKNRIVDLDL